VDDLKLRLVSVMLSCTVLIAMYYYVDEIRNGNLLRLLVRRRQQ